MFCGTLILGLFFQLSSAPPQAGINVEDEGSLQGRATSINFTGDGVTCTYSSPEATCDIAAGGGGGAPTNATYITQTSNATLSAEQILADLSTGILKVTTSTGVLSTAVAGDFPTLNQNTTGTAAALAADPSDCATSTHFAVGVNASGTATCEAIADADVPDTISLTNITQITNRAISDTSGTLAVSRGGTNLTASTDDNAMIGNGTTWESKTLPDCDGDTTVLHYDTATNAFSCGDDDTGGGGGATVTIVRLAADSALSTTTKTNLSGISFTLSASTNYTYECHMYTTANAATVGVQFAITFGGTVSNVRGMFQGPGAATTLLWISDNSFQLDFNPTASQGNVAGMVVLSGTVEVSGTGGTLQFQHGSETATLTTVQRGSFCKLIQ